MEEVLQWVACPQMLPMPRRCSLVCCYYSVSAKMDSYLRHSGAAFLVISAALFHLARSSALVEPPLSHDARVYSSLLDSAHSLRSPLYLATLLRRHAHLACGRIEERLQ